MRRIIFVLAIGALTSSICPAQAPRTGNSEKPQKDSLAHSKMIEDSLKMQKLLAISEYPYIKGGKWSGVIPVADPTEIPEPKRDYKLLFEFANKNPDSLAKEISGGLDNVARVLNLHFASGIPAKNIIPVIVIDGPGIEAVMNNESYQKRHSMDNPNLKLIQDLENAGTKFMVCGQAMAFSEIKREELLPEVKVSLTAQTVLSNYQLQGFVLYQMRSGR